MVALAQKGVRIGYIDTDYILENVPEYQEINQQLNSNVEQWRKEIENRRDLREEITFTIDPEDAKDFDDAISFSELEKGIYEIGVHIADVTH